MPSDYPSVSSVDNESNTIFIVRQAGPRLWDVSAPDHSVGGIFRSCEDACRYARGEARVKDHAEIVVLGDDMVDLQTFQNHRPVGHATYALSAAR